MYLLALVQALNNNPRSLGTKGEEWRELISYEPKYLTQV